MTQRAPVVFLLDVDNTLLDDDSVTADLKRHLTQTFGAVRQERHWAIFEERRTELGHSDHLGALPCYRAEEPHDPPFLQVSFFLSEHSLADCLHPGSLDVIERIGDLLRYDLPALLPSNRVGSNRTASEPTEGEK